jgi:hypothetical protein
MDTQLYKSIVGFNTRPSFEKQKEMCQTVREVSERIGRDVRERRAQFKAEGTLTPKGVQMEMGQLAHGLLTEIRTVRATYVDVVQADVNQRAADLVKLPAEKDSAAEAIRECWWLDKVLALRDPGDRANAVRMAIDAGDERAFRALLTAPAVVVGQLGLQGSIIVGRTATGEEIVQQEDEITMLRERWAELRSPGAAAELAELRQALAMAKAALDSTERFVRRECGLGEEPPEMPAR